MAQFVVGQSVAMGPCATNGIHENCKEPIIGGILEHVAHCHLEHKEAQTLPFEPRTRTKQFSNLGPILGHEGLAPALVRFVPIHVFHEISAIEKLIRLRKLQSIVYIDLCVMRMCGG